MIRRSLLGMTFALIGATTEAQEAPAPPTGRAYKVAFWYELDRPFSTVKYRAYDLAKGEYDEKAVDAWLRTILDKHPRYGACVREVRTVDEPGATEADRLANAVDREKRRWSERNRRIALKPTFNLVGPPASTGPRIKAPGRTSFDLPAPGSPGGIANPPTSPFPYPYRSGPR